MGRLSLGPLRALPGSRVLNHLPGIEPPSRASLFVGEGVVVGQVDDESIETLLMSRLTV